MSVEHELELPTEPERAARGRAEEYDRGTQGQREINRIWERTQQTIALLVVVSTLVVAAFKAIFDALSDPSRGIAAGPAFLFLVGASNLVIGFYFGRTNHTRTGGVDVRERER